MPFIFETADGEITLSREQLKDIQDEDVTELPGVQDKINQVAGKTRAKAKETARQELAQDEDAFREIAAAHGLELGDDLTPKGVSKKTKELRKELAQAQSQAKEAEKLKGKVQKLRRTKLENELLKRTGDAVADDMRDILVRDAEQMAVYDEDDDTYYPKADDGAADYSGSLDTVVERLKDKRPTAFRSSKANTTGTNNDTNNGSGSGQTYTEQQFTEKMQNAADLSDEEYNSLMAAYKNGRVQ